MGDDRQQYREVIDRLVLSCREGQGQVGARRARSGMWNLNAEKMPDLMPDQLAVNALLKRLDHQEREVLAQLLAEAFTGGVHETLAVLQETGIPPFDDAYEGAPFNDFVGRLDDWPWPTAHPDRRGQ